MMRIFSNRIRNAEALFRDHYIDVKAFYAARWGRVPCVTFVGELDITAAFAYLSEQLVSQVVDVYQHAYFDHETGSIFFNTTVFVLRQNRMVELSANYCHVLHTPRQYAWACELARQLAQFKVQAEPVNAPPTIVGFAREAQFN